MKWVAAILGLVLMAVLFGREAAFISTGQNDFAPLYVAGRQAGGADLYAPEPYAEFLAERFGVVSPSLRFTRLPYYALLLKPLSYLPYSAAYALWVLLRLAAIVGFVLLWPAGLRATAVAAICCSLPLIGALLNGQDAPLLALVVVGAIRLQQNHRLFASGLVWSLCSIKFQLFLPLPLLLFASGRRRVLEGFGAGALAQVLLSYWVAGWQWPSTYLGLLSDERTMQVGIESDRVIMPNLHGLLGGTPWIEVAATLAVLALCGWALRRTGLTQGAAIVLVGGALTSYHAFLADWSLLLAAGLLVWESSRPGSALRLWTLAILAPPVALLVPLGRGFSFAAVVVVAAYLLALVSAWSRPSRGPQPVG